MKKYTYFLLLVWIMIMATSYFWTTNNAKQAHRQIALKTANSFFTHLEITRNWNASHGGVYVPVTEFIQPNPYLKVPNRDIYVNEKLQLTMINPAFMTRQISEFAKKSKGVEFHITSLDPINPGNKATPREKQALESFEKGAKEVGEFIEKDNKEYFFYMAPLETKESCLKCHADQGYKVGDIRGGISVSFAFDDNVSFLTLTLWHIFIIIFGITGILIFTFKLSNAYNKIKKQSVIDALTGIPNRRSFSEKIVIESRLNHRNKNSLSVIMCDIDHFKLYNDTLDIKKVMYVFKRLQRLLVSV